MDYLPHCKRKNIWYKFLDKFEHTHVVPEKKKLLERKIVTMFITIRFQWHSQNVEKVTHSKGDYWIKQCPFSLWELLLKERICLRGSQFFPLREVPYGMENYLYHIR